MIWGLILTWISLSTSKGACVFSILTQDASEALNLIFQLSVPVLLTYNTHPSFIDTSAPLEKKKSKWGHLLGRIHLKSRSFNAWQHGSNKLFRWHRGFIADYVILGRDFFRMFFHWKKIQNRDTFCGAFIWSRHLLTLNHTTVKSFFFGIKAFSLTWCKFGGGIFCQRLFHWKNS